MQALRSSTVGIDLDIYHVTFDAIRSRNLFESIAYANGIRMEAGIAIIMKLIGVFGGWQLFVAVTAIFINTVVCVFAYKESDYPLLFFLLYIGLDLFVFSFSGLRQMYAISICMIAFGFLKNKRYIKFILCVLLASLFHVSALIFLATIFLKLLKFNDIWAIFFILIMLVIMIFAYPIAHFVISIFFPRYINYISDQSSFGLLGIFYILTFILLILMNKTAKGTENGFLLFFVAVAACCQMFGNVTTITSRLTFFFIPYVGLSLTNSVNTKSYFACKTKYFMVLIYALFAIVVFFIPNLINSYLQITPYKFFWQ